MTNQENRPPSITEKLRQKIRGVRGVGDVISGMTKMVGVKPCSSCDERRKQLNKLIPFGSNNESEGKTK